LAAGAVLLTTVCGVHAITELAATRPTEISKPRAEPAKLPSVRMANAWYGARPLSRQALSTTTSGRGQMSARASRR
jgi:hypothetical protein